MLDPLTSTAFAIHNSKGVYALLLGSGISRAANVPTGWEVTLDLIRRIAVMRSQTEQCDADPEAWFRANFRCEPSYSDLLEHLATSPAERTAALARYFESGEDEDGPAAKPTAAHVAIAKMVKRGYFRVLLTTNFDRLLERALEAEGVSPSILSTPDAVHGAMPLAHSACTIIKLHGDYRDGRLRNTVAELTDYDETTRGLLDRVLDDYGLIVSGWSATWDVALRDAIMRTPNRRFTTLWSYVGSLSAEAEQVIHSRLAQKVEVTSADSFFVQLNEKLESLESFDTPHPLSVELAVRAAKRYVAEDRYRIQLHDLVMAETDQVVNAAKQLSVNAKFTDDLYLKRIELYETITQRLIPVIINVAYWGDQSSLRLLTSVVERLMVTGTGFNGTTGWLDLQLYPAALVFYAAGLGLLAAERYEGLRFLTRDFRTSAVDLNRRVGLALPRLGLQGILDKDTLNRILGKNFYVPYSERVHGLFSAVVAKQLPGVQDFDDLFDFFEFLGSLIVTDDRMASDEGWVCGWFGKWAFRDSLGKNVRTTMKADRDRLGVDWPIVKAGIFANLERFDEVHERHKTDCASRARW
ncbi:SIR2 family protein [Acidicapsa ligni]|uniref:SIR2 family protein n=1 Tax=Acidicapsa ligni TaxID=542300 RepID=UPI0021E082A7|nr:SIR2 family protein [Acidicapsa ligni]